jgi:hypothetical protein
MELTNAFIDSTKGFVIPAGTVLVLCSASHLAGTGTESYAAEFIEARKKIEWVMGEGIVLLHGFPILAHGTADRALARSILDIEHWVNMGSKGRDIAHTRQHFITITLALHSRNSVPVRALIRLGHQCLASAPVRLGRRLCTP